MTDTIAFVLYPGITALDLVGPLQVLSALGQAGLGHEVVVVADRLEPMGTDTPLALTASHTFADVPSPHALVVPGGDVATIRAMTDERLLA
nr:hypothetical protein [Saccharothrix deserti]